MDFSIILSLACLFLRAELQSTMVCLKHAESVCSQCPLNQCFARYTCSIEYLETALEKVSQKLTAFEAWRSEFSHIFLSPSSRAQSVASDKDDEMKNEATDAVMNLDTFTVSADMNTGPYRYIYIF